MTFSPLPNWKKLHLVGVGGAGMAPLAHYLHTQGFEITGSDKQSGAATQFLQNLGITIYIGHQPEQVQSAQALIISSAIDNSNPEVVEARKRGIPVQKRAAVLGEIIKKYWSLAVAGTHGKTTTTLMLGAILENAGLDPVVVAGGTPVRGSEGARLGGAQLVVVEADEYDQSFLQFLPTYVLVTNISEDHMECYGDRASLDGAFVQFAHSVPPFGAVVMCLDDPGVRAILPRLHRPFLSYGFSEGYDYSASDMQSANGVIQYTVQEKEGGVKTRISLNVPGVHNVLNSLGAFALCRAYGLSAKQIARGLATFYGAKRRIEFKAKIAERVCIDDYAHHPEEVAATLGALRLSHPTSRLLAIFQPHLFSRTARFFKEFAEQLCKADFCVILPIYASREQPLDGVHSSLIVEELVKMGYSQSHIHTSGQVSASAANQIWKLTQPGDVLVTLGAGDVTHLHGHWQALGAQA